MKPLSARETEVMFLLCHGHSNKECAELIGCSLKTIEKHRQTVYYKWNVCSITAMIRVALRDRHMSLDFFLESKAGEGCHHERPQRFERINP